MVFIILLNNPGQGMKILKCKTINKTIIHCCYIMQYYTLVALCLYISYPLLGIKPCDSDSIIQLSNFVSTCSIECSNITQINV